MTPSGTTPGTTSDVLVAYASKHGATAGIATTIGDELRAHGLRVDVRPAAEVDDVGGYRIVVLGSAVYLGRWRPEAVAFLRRHTDALRGREVRLFQSGPCGPDAATQQAEPGRVRRLRTGIDTGPPVTFAGRLDAGSGVLARWMARGALGGDFRDPELIRSWARDIAASTDPSAAPAAPPSHSDRAAT